MKKITVFLLSIVLFLGCKKYEDGPCIYPGNKYNRLDGNWKITAFIKNGDNGITAEYISKLGCSITFYEHNKGDNLVFFNECSGIMWRTFGEYSLADKGEKLQINLRYTLDLEPFNLNNLVFEVKRFKKKEIWLYCERNENVYELRLKR